jgi:hypothetical protein
MIALWRTDVGASPWAFPRGFRLVAEVATDLLEEAFSQAKATDGVSVLEDRLTAASGYVSSGTHGSSVWRSSRI